MPRIVEKLHLMRAIYPAGRRNCTTLIVAAFTLALPFLAFEPAHATNRAHRPHQDEYPGQHWKIVSRPEERGWSSQKLGVAKAYADSIDTAAVMVIDDGVVVGEWGETSKAFNVHSIRKSFLSALYGTAVPRREIELPQRPLARSAYGAF